MILLSVGTQLPFPRLVNAVDRWVIDDESVQVIAQIGAETVHFPRNFQYFDFIENEKFEKLQQECELIVSHAGIGSIMKAIEYKKPIIIMPRLRKFREHRNDHQMSTARYFFNFPNVYVARDDFDLIRLLNDRQSITYKEGLCNKNAENFSSQIQTMLEDLRPLSKWSHFLNALGL